MTTSILSAAALMAMRPLQNPQADVQCVVLEAPALDPETRSRLLQFGPLVKSASAASSRLLILTEELKGNGLRTMGPPIAEVLSDPVAMEELKRKKQRESELAQGLRKGLQDYTRTQADLQRGISFLMPGILLKDEEIVGLPGFESPMENPADLDTSGLIWNSHGEFFAQISALLEVLKTEWLADYQGTLSKFLEFYQEFSDIMESLKPSGSGDKGDIKIDFTQVHAALMKLAADYGLDKNAFASFDSQAGAEAFRDSLDLPGLVVTGPGAGGKYYVKMDVSAVNDLIKSMENPNNPGKPLPSTLIMNSAEYNAWVSAKDSNMEQIKYVSKVLGEKLNEMTQKYDNIVKILSSSIDKMSEANNAYVHNT